MFRLDCPQKAGNQKGTVGLFQGKGIEHSWYEGVKGNNETGRVKWGQDWESSAEEEVW